MQHVVICIKVNVMVIFILSDLSNIDNLQLLVKKNYNTSLLLSTQPIK